MSDTSNIFWDPASNFPLLRSTNNVHTLAFWREKQGGAEHWLTLKARLSEIWKVLCRLYVTDGELLDSQGTGTGIYVEIMFSADKPATPYVPHDGTLLVRTQLLWDQLQVPRG